MDIDEIDERSPDCPEATAQANQLRERFDRLLATLDEPRRTVFVLYEIEELTMAEVAAAVGCPLQTAYSRHSSAKKMILAAAKRLETKEGAR
jgi:RNA polymerase sigma-70 factor (ECF subfamily)